MSQKFILFVTLFAPSGYWYDAGGERVIKASGDDEGIYVNDVFSGARTETNNFTAYINPYLVVSKGGQYTKHIYIGSQRIVSKLGDLESYGQDPRRIEYAGTNVDGAKVDYAAKYKQSQQTIKDNYAYFEVDYNGTDNDDYVNGGGFCCDDTPKTRSFDPSKNDNPELFQYYYHADHLGSSSLITNLDGEVVQHIEYVPFGEVFIEERNNKWNTPYLFNAKELDEETGLYYYGARYYDSRSSVWLSTDPLQEEYPDISTYTYTGNNPVKYTDPTGMYWVGGDGKIVTHWTDKNGNIQLSSNKTADLQKYVNALNTTRSVVGIKAFKEAHRNQTKINFQLNTTSIGDDIGLSVNPYPLVGLHQPHDAAGNKLRWNEPAQKFDGDIAFLPNGEYKEATITIFEQTMSDHVQNKKDFLFELGGFGTPAMRSRWTKTLTDIIQLITVVSHEIKHDTDPQTRQAVDDRQHNRINTYDVEEPAYDVTKEIYDEQLQ